MLCYQLVDRQKYNPGIFEYTIIEPYARFDHTVIWPYR